MNIDTSINGDMCLADSATTHTILKEKKYFSYLVKRETNVNTMSGTTKIFCYMEEQIYILKMPYIPLNLKETY
jgi:hypothetical protein